MKKIFSTLLIMLISIGSLTANSKRDTAKDRKFNELRNQILIEKLALTKAEQAAFLPLYKEYKEKEQEITQKTRRTIKASRNEKLTEAEAEKLLVRLKNLNQQKATLYKTYSDKFNAVLPAKKVIQLYAVEREIRRMLMDKIKERRKEK